MDVTQKFVHAMAFDIRWCDMDAFGHVNNSVYFSYFEMVRIAWWHASVEATAFDKVGPVLVNASCTFLKSIVYPEKITVQLSVGPAGRSSYDCFYRIVATSEPDTCYAEGNTKVVWVDRTTGKSVALPDAIRALLPGA